MALRLTYSIDRPEPSSGTSGSIPWVIAVIMVPLVVAIIASPWLFKVAAGYWCRHFRPPKIAHFGYVPEGAVEPGAAIKVHWRVECAEWVRIAGLGTGDLPHSGSELLRPSRSITLRLVAGNPSGFDAFRDLDVHVLDLPPVPPNPGPPPDTVPPDSGSPPSPEPPSTPAEAVIQDTHRPCLQPLRIIALRDGAIGSPVWEFKVTVGEAHASLGPWKFSDGNPQGISAAGADCLPLDDASSGSVPVRITAWRQNGSDRAHGEAQLTLAPIPQVIPVRNPAGESRGSFLFEVLYRKSGSR